MDLFIRQLNQIQIGQNTGGDYAFALVVFFGLLILLKLFQVFIVARLKRLSNISETKFDDTVIEIFENIKPPFYLLIALYFGIRSIVLPDIAEKAVSVLFIITVTYEVIGAISRLIDYGLGVYTRNAKEDGKIDEHSESMVRTMRLIIKVVLWIVGLLLILSNLNINVSSLVASLGIGGIAIALALQNVLGDVFSSFSIYVDKPFKIGDFIIIGTDSGTVEKIGLKTTRIRTLQGEELVVSNNELTTARIQNFKKMKRRRVLFQLGVIYGTKPEQLESISRIIKEIVDEIDGVDYDRCHFATYGDFSLNFEIVFYVNSSDYSDYMNKKEKANLAIYKRFAQEKIEFAYPTQTIFVNK
jgi:small-conductance mechanosensitive channel